MYSVEFNLNHQHCTHEPIQSNFFNPKEYVYWIAELYNCIKK